MRHADVSRCETRRLVPGNPRLLISTARPGRHVINDRITRPDRNRVHRGMKVFYSDTYGDTGIAFDTFNKAKAVAELLPATGVDVEAPTPLTIDQVLRAHTDEYVSALETGTPPELAATQGLGWSPSLLAAVRASAGGVLQAGTTALESGGAAGSLSSGLHHARADRGQGFCTINGLAITALLLADRGYRTLILDFDAHCGGGTASLIANTPLISQIDVSVSAYDRYQPVGQCHLQLADGNDYLGAVTGALQLAGEGPRPDLVLYNAGVDVHEHAGGVRGITTDTVAEREQHTFEWCARNDLPVAWVLAGGYSSATFPASDVAHLHLSTVTAALNAGGCRS